MCVDLCGSSGSDATDAVLIPAGVCEEMLFLLMFLDTERVYVVQLQQPTKLQTKHLASAWSLVVEEFMRVPSRILFFNTPFITLSTVIFI